MQINLIAVGKRMPTWVNESLNEYRKRLPKELRLNLIEITPIHRSKSISVSKAIEGEHKRIQSSIPANNIVIALDEGGEHLSSTMLANKLKEWMHQTQDISLIIGGADGLSESFKQSSDETWALSAMTLPHALVRVIIAEQVYRAWSIMSNHPYHRE